jgi:hypothetical protein
MIENLVLGRIEFFAARVLLHLAFVTSGCGCIHSEIPPRCVVVVIFCLEGSLELALDGRPPKVYKASYSLNNSPVLVRNSRKFLHDYLASCPNWAAACKKACVIGAARYGSTREIMMKPAPSVIGKPIPNRLSCGAARVRIPSARLVISSCGRRRSL